MSIKIDLKIFLFTILFWFTKQIELYALLMAFAFFHEIGHLVCGLMIGVKPESIKINPLGFQIQFRTPVEDYNKKVKNGNEHAALDCLIAIAGPLINIFMIIICLFLPQSLDPARTTIVYANLLLAIFNLLPVYPLDGGRILKEMVHILKGKEKSYEIVNTVSKATVITLTVIASIAILSIHNIALLLILAYLWYLMIQNEKRYHMKKVMYEQVRSEENSHLENLENEKENVVAKIK